MLTLTIAFRTLTKRRGRMALIGVLVAFGTFILVFGGIFASSVAAASRASIIDNFTGDFIIYSDRSKELPSPFAFNTPLPVIRNVAEIEKVLASHPLVESYAFYSQNYGLIQADRDGKKIDLPFIFYAVEPGPYRAVFSNLEVREGSFFGLEAPGQGAAGGAEPGVLISDYQSEQYRKDYGVTLRAGDPVTLLGITEGGVNAAKSKLLGIFRPRRYQGVFNYINFMDAATYSALYNYTGVEALPADFNAALEAASADEASLFDLGSSEAFGSLDLSALKSEALSGFTMAAVKLTDHGELEKVIADLGSRADLGIKIARWDAASGFYAQIARALQAFIFIATALIFLVVIMIFMNTLIVNVVERTAEIGTMRAIGADKSFVRGVFLAETLMLNISAALVSMAVSGTLLALFGSGGVPLPEPISQFLIGGGPLTLRVEAAPFAIALVLVAAVSVIAVIYPVRVASSITPLAAMSER